MFAVRCWSAVALAAATVGSLLASSALPAGAAAPATALHAADNAMLESVSAVSSSDAWAVGTVIEHWNGRRWSVVPGAAASGCHAFFNGVAVRSASLAWTVGYCGPAKSQRPVIERWNGRRWSVQASPRVPASPASELFSVTASSAANAWAVGQYRSGGRTVPLIEHWNGRAWTRQTSADPGHGGTELAGVTALSRTDAWAVGISYGATLAESKSLAEHWNGHSWHETPTVSPGGQNGLAGVSALSPASVWSAGFYTFGDNLGTLAEHWDGTSWDEPSTPGPDLKSFLLAVAAHSPSDVWTVGGHQSISHPRTLIQHWNGTKWSVVPSPSPSGLQDLLQGVAVVSGRYAWAVGYQGHYKTLIERWNGSAWKVVPSPN
jgi:hypothetical protein